jgi:hypothetical protein
LHFNQTRITSRISLANFLAINVAWFLRYFICFFEKRKRISILAIETKIETSFKVNSAIW